MGKIKIQALVEIYETNGNEVPIGLDYPQLIVQRHWNWSQDRVILQIGEDEITVLTKDLLSAIKAVTI